jgi:TPR repeat protein
MRTFLWKYSGVVKGLVLAAISMMGFVPFSFAVDVNSTVPHNSQTTQNGDMKPVSINQEVQRGSDYLRGRGVAKDLVQAAYWYRKAAEHGDPGAQTMLSYMYFAGAGVPKNVHEALLWDLRAAGAGSVEAKVNLAAMFLHGDGVKQDQHEAFLLLQEAAAKHNGRAEAYLGTMYGLGLGVPPDYSKAKTWFEKGVKQHSPEAEFGLATLEATGQVRNLAHETTLLRLSAADGYVPAMHSLGLLLVNHPELPRDAGEEVRMLISAAEAGFWKSSAVLGMLSRDGRYLAQNLEVSYRWFRIAVLQGGAPAEAYLGSTLRFQGQRLGASEQALLDKDGGAWMLAHPIDDLFTFSDGITGGAIADREAYAAIQALQHAAKKEATN